MPGSNQQLTPDAANQALQFRAIVAQVRRSEEERKRRDQAKEEQLDAMLVQLGELRTQARNLLDMVGEIRQTILASEQEKSRQAAQHVHED